MLFEQRFWDGLSDGTITVAVRRWRRPTVKAGGSLRSPGGVLAIDEVVRIEVGDLSDQDAFAPGFANADEALAGLRPEGDLYRIRFHRVGEDPRVELRRREVLDEPERSNLIQALDRLDWAMPTLRLIAEHPATPSHELAARQAVERAKFKRRVRRLKELGLTESLKSGYRLSPRGDAVLAEIGP